MVKLTKSNFLNHVLNNYAQHSLSETVKQYKDLVTSHVDVCIYNSIITDEKDQFPNANPIDIRNYHDEIIAKLVSGYGKTKTAYSEFLRAFEKLMYRLFNDGDSVISGPYSAINFYLAKYDGDRKFNMSESDFGFIGFDIYKDSDENEINEDKRYSIESAFNDIIMCLSNSNGFYPDQCDMLSNKFSYMNQSRNYATSISNWINAVVFMLDQLTDEWKGTDQIPFEDAIKYYKNVMEYRNPELYQFLSDRGCTEWECDSFKERDYENTQYDDGYQSITIEPSNSYRDSRYNLIFRTSFCRSYVPELHAEFEFNINEESDEINTEIEKILEWSKEFQTLKKLTSLTLKDFLKYGSNKKDNINDAVEIVEVIKDDNNDSYTDHAVVYNGILCEFNDESLMNRKVISVSGFLSKYQKNGNSNKVNRINIEMKKEVENANS